MSRAKPRGSHGDALFDWTDPGTGDVQPSEVADNPRLVTCPVCRAKRGEPCTRPSRRGRIPLTRDRGYHPSRGAPT